MGVTWYPRYCPQWGGRLARRSVLVTALVSLLALAWPSVAAAHDASTAADPGDGAVAERGSGTAPLPMVSTLDESASVVTVTGPGGDPAAAGQPASDGVTVSGVDGGSTRDDAATAPSVARSDADDDRSGPWWAKVVAGVMVVLGVVSCIELIRRRGA